MDIENYVMTKYLDKIIKTDEKGRYVTESDLISFKLTGTEYVFILNILKKKQIAIRKGYVFCEDDKLLSKKTVIYEKRDNTFDGIEDFSDLDKITLSKIKEYRENNSIDLRNEIIVDNLKLVNFVARQISMIATIDAQELVGYGYEGLICAIEKFNVKRKIAFSKFADYYIRDFILQGITEVKGIDKELKDYYWKYLEYKNSLEKNESQTLVENPELIEIILSYMSKIDSSNGVELWRQLITINELSNSLIDDSKLSQDMLLEEFDDSQEISYDKNIIDNEGIAESFEEKIFLDITVSILMDILQSTDERASEIIKLYFGLDDGYCKSLNAIADKFGISAERVRQIKKKALNMLRKPRNIRKLRVL